MHRYSFIVFHGFINDIAAKETGLTEGDVSKMLGAIWHGTNSLSTTSKYGQQSRLLLRMRYKKPLGYIGDLDRRISLLPSPSAPDIDLSKLEDISQVVLDISAIGNTIQSNGSVLDGIDYRASPDLICKLGSKLGKLSELFKDNELTSQLSD